MKLGLWTHNFPPTTVMPPEGPGERPPNVILDSVYAAVALQAWGPKDFHTYAREQMKGTYYESVEDDSEGDAEDNEDDGEDSEMLEASTSAQPIHGHNLRRRNAVPRAGRRAETHLGDIYTRYCLGCVDAHYETGATEAEKPCCIECRSR
jgi:hypothetical protein